MKPSHFQHESTGRTQTDVLVKGADPPEPLTPHHPAERRGRGPSGRRWSDLSLEQQAKLVEGMASLHSLATDVGTPLTATCTALAPECDFSLTLTEQDESPRCAVASSNQARLLTERQIEDNDGPTIEALAKRDNVFGVNLSESGEQWPRFASLATAVGYVTMNVVVLGMGTSIFGALSAFRREDTNSFEPRVDLLTGLARAGATAVANQREHERLTQLSDQLQVALHSRILIEQAKGMLAARLAVDTESAFSLLRRYARSNGKRLHDVAQGVLDGDITALDLRIINRRSSA